MNSIGCTHMFARAHTHNYFVTNKNKAMNLKEEEMGSVGGREGGAEVTYKQ